MTISFCQYLSQTTLPPSTSSFSQKGSVFPNYWFVPEDFLLNYDAKEIASHFDVSEQDEFDDYI
jgi:hypothetical protein